MAKVKGNPKKRRSEHEPPLHIVKREAFSDGTRTVLKVVQDPLDSMISRGSVSKRQAIAGEKLREDHLLGVEGARDPEAHGSGGSMIGLGEAQLFALTAFKDAVRHLGVERSAIVVPVVCGGVELKCLAPRLRLPRNKLAALFGAALDALADHYRVPRDRAEERDLALNLLTAYLPQGLSDEMLDGACAAR